MSLLPPGWRSSASRRVRRPPKAWCGAAFRFFSSPAHMTSCLGQIADFVAEALPADLLLARAARPAAQAPSGCPSFLAGVSARLSFLHYSLSFGH